MRRWWKINKKSIISAHYILIEYSEIPKWVRLSQGVRQAGPDGLLFELGDEVLGLGSLGDAFKDVNGAVLAAARWADEDTVLVVVDLRRRTSKRTTSRLLGRASSDGWGRRRARPTLRGCCTNGGK